MKYILAIAAAFLLLLSATPSVFAQDTTNEWNTLNQEVMKLYHAGEYSRAIIVAIKALEVAEENTGPDHPDVAMSLNDLAELYRI